MRQLIRVFFLMLFAALATCVAMASSASAELPKILFLGGNQVATEIKSLANTIEGHLETAASELKGKGALVVLHLTAAATEPLGAADVLFENVVLNGKNCNTSGDGVGLVLLPDVSGNQTEWHLVFDALGSGTALKVAVLFLVPEFEIICGTAKLKVKGSVLALVTPINTEVLETANSAEFESQPKCSATHGKPEDLTWYNNAGTAQTAQLLAKFGLNFEEACEQLNSVIKLQPTTMIEIMG
jgi:hypothetical protein